MMRNQDGLDWLGDTNGWLDRGHEDPRERHFRELREKAEAKERRQRALQQNEASRVVLDDDGFRVLANALLLAWWKPGHIDDNRARREVNTELRQLRDFLDSEGVIAPEIDCIDSCGPNEFADRMKAIFLSPVAFAQVEIKDLSAPNGEQFPLELKQCFANASRGELRSRIVHMGRCTFTLALRDMVIRYFEGADIWGDTVKPVNGGPRAGDAVAKAKKAQKVLEDIHSEDSERRLRRADAIDCLTKCGFTGNESKAIWQCSSVSKWKQSGKIRADVARVPLDYLQKRLAEET